MTTFAILKYIIVFHCPIILFVFIQSVPSQKKGFQLFDSDDDDDDDEQINADEYQFEKPQYEGKSGAKVSCREMQVNISLQYEGKSGAKVGCRQMWN